MPCCQDDTGVCFRAGDAESLAQVVTALCRNEQRRKELGERASKWVRQHRTWEAVVQEYANAYGYVLQGKQVHEKRVAVG